jgi:flavin-dependent dehydrogenase
MPGRTVGGRDDCAYDLSKLSKAKTDRQLDVLVLGAHPSAYFAAALLAHNRELRVIHAPIPGEGDPDRLVLINPALFDLDPLLNGIQKKLDLEPIFGLIFLGDRPPTRSEHRSKTQLSAVGSLKALRSAMAHVAESAGVELAKPTALLIRRVDETGVDVLLGKTEIHPRVLVLGGILPAEQQKVLGIPDSWGGDIVHRYAYLKVPTAKSVSLGSVPLIPMSLNLGETLAWAWLLPGKSSMQLAVEVPVEKLAECRPMEQLARWVEVLTRHGILQWKGEIPAAAVRQIDMPLAGALANEGVANRTLLIGPAGGFYAATAEDIYPNCWSALFAAETLAKALTERHLQDALNTFRTLWRTTLGEHLRGPQQNLRFLLPMVYRNPVMTTRLCEAILLGKNVVR